MHELSVCRSLIRQATDIAISQNADNILSITLEIGPLSGIDAELLDQAFQAARTNTLAQNAQLVIKHKHITVSCDDCGKTARADVNKLSCSLCGSNNTRLLSGTEMLLVSIDIDRNTHSEVTSSEAISNQESRLH